MKCQKCNQREATTHMTQIINGVKSEYHLCSECAKDSPEMTGFKHGFDFGVGDFLSGIFAPQKQSPSALKSGGICPTCGMSFSVFLNHGKLGCSDCYGAFRGRLAEPLRQIHGTCEHIGKVPGRMGGKVKTAREVSRLEAELNAAVMKQDFERAAQLRDKINEIKKEGK